MKNANYFKFILSLSLLPLMSLAANPTDDMGLSRRADTSSQAMRSLKAEPPSRDRELDLGERSRSSRDQDSLSTRVSLKERKEERRKSIGGGDPGGGHPLLVKAVSYPDQAGLNRAIALALSRLQASHYPQEFKNQLALEITTLKEADLFRFLPELILLQSLEGSELEQNKSEEIDIADDMVFTSLGAITWLKPGTAVIFSNRATKYDTEALAELLLHEVIHHVAPISLSKDDTFVEDLAQSIVSGETDADLDLAFKIGTYFRPGMISRDQFWDAMEVIYDIDQPESKYHGFQSYIIRRYHCGKNEACVSESMKAAKAKFASLLPKDLSNLTVGKVEKLFAQAVKNHIQVATRGDSSLAHMAEMKAGAFSASAMNRIAKRTNPQAPDLIPGFWGFKNSDEIRDLLMKDYYLPH